LLTGDEAAGGGEFAVGWVGGLLTTTGTVDREQLCPQQSSASGRECVVVLEVSVTPVEYFRVIRVRVHVLDVNDNAPRFPVDAVTVAVYELATPGHTPTHRQRCVLHPVA